MEEEESRIFSTRLDLRELTETVVELLAIFFFFFSNWWRLGEVPEAWKSITRVPIFEERQTKGAKEL